VGHAYAYRSAGTHGLCGGGLAGNIAKGPAVTKGAKVPPFLCGIRQAQAAIAVAKPKLGTDLLSTLSYMRPP